MTVLDATWTPAQRRERAVVIAGALVGLGPDAAAYRDLCYPHDNPLVAEQMARTQSACALVCAGVLRHLGFEHAELASPYAWRFANHPPRRPADAMTRLQIMGAWHPDPVALPLAGEMIIIGSGLGTHALTCVDIDPYGGTITSVDGGRGAIRYQTRTIVHTPARVGLRDGMGTRWIVGVLAVGDLLCTAPWSLPAAH